MKGTEKQVEWAKKIKDVKIAEANAFILEFGEEADRDGSGPLWKRVNRCRTFLADVETKADAVWYINNRNSIVYAYGMEGEWR